MYTCKYRYRAKKSISKTIGRIKGKCAVMIIDRHPKYRERADRYFWARGHYCEKGGNVNEETIRNISKINI